MKIRICTFGKFARCSAVALAITFLVSLTSASATPDQVCDSAALAASEETKVPLDVLRTITRTETGLLRLGRLQPWPWTVNIEGEGHWFQTEAEAQAFVFEHFKRGIRSFDIGCFQINYRWHSQAFRSIEEMFDPAANAVYAARFLSKLHAEFGAWTSAAGAYHSRTPKYARTYKTRFAEVHAGLPPMHVGARTATTQQTNVLSVFHRLHTSKQRGSLVPLSLDPHGSLFPSEGAANG
ncbi:transglycosylase SLT domain-containing protein [Tateyamaria sp. SN3-11]|uniref:transglycosylase SLT domain-containing protein n=1 Tax=Tateyamaria sp. SN3-11 TaxID=3092147 RepID=UPI0039ECB0F7